MLKKLPANPQLEMFKTILTSFVHPDHKLCLLAKEIDWASLEKEFAQQSNRIALKIYHDLVSQLNPIPKQAYMETFNV